MKPLALIVVATMTIVGVAAIALQLWWLLASIVLLNTALLACHLFNTPTEYRLAKTERANVTTHFDEQRLESAIAGDLSITPGMLPSEQWHAIELLRCIVAENMLRLKAARETLGTDSIDWIVELVQLLETHWEPEVSYPYPLSPEQCLQVMNSYLDYLIQQDGCESLSRECQAA